MDWARRIRLVTKVFPQWVGVIANDLLLSNPIAFRGQHACFRRRQTPALVVAFGNTNKKRRPFVKPTTILGRARTADVRLDSIEISAIHCIITRTATGLTIRDCESKCGTLVNDHPIREAELKHGDHVQVGPFLFRVDSPPVDAEVERNTQFVDAREQIDSANLKEELDQMRAVLLAREIALRNERDEFEKTRTQWHDERNVFETQLESLHQSQLKAALPGPEIAAALVELEVVKRQLVERDQQREELDQRLRSITKERNELTFELEHLRQESLQQEQASADDSNSLHEDVEDIAPLKQELVRQEALNFQLAEKLAELQNEITLLKRRPERQDLGLTVAPAIKDKPNGLSSSDVDCLCAQDQQLLEQLSGQSREISASAGSSGNQSADLQAQLNLQLEQYSALDQKYRGVLNKYQALVEEETKLRDQFDRLKADHETLVTSFVKVSADLQELTKTHETMKSAREKEVTSLKRMSNVCRQACGIGRACVFWRDVAYVVSIAYQARIGTRITTERSQAAVRENPIGFDKRESDAA